MRLYCTKDYQKMSRKAAGIIGAQVVLKPDSVLGLQQVPRQSEPMNI